MKEYTCGFIFDLSANRVLLLKKKPGTPNENLWNGHGGSVEPGELPEDCIIRETREELGIFIDDNKWHKFVELTGSNFRGDWKVHFFRAFSDKISEAKQMEIEEIGIFQVKLLPKVAANVPWLIQMALCVDFDSADSFTVQERY